MIRRLLDTCAEHQMRSLAGPLNTDARRSGARANWLQGVEPPAQVSIGMRTGLVVALVALAGLILLEGAVRVRQRIRYGTMRMSLVQTEVDPASGLMVPAKGDVTGSVWINSLGFRGPELDAPKPPGRIRLAYVGASTTFCAEASSNEATWPHLVWKALQQKWPSRKFDYLNAGVPGYRVESSLRNLEVRVQPLQPDVIVIYEGINDITADTRAAARSQGLFQGKADDPSLLSQYSLTWLLLEKNVELLARQRRAAKGVGRLVVDPQTLSQGFRTRLRDLITAAQHIAPVVAVATLSQKPRRDQSPEQQLQACNTALYYMPYMSVEGILTVFEAYNRVIRELAGATGAILIDGENTIPGTEDYFDDSVHFNDAGCERMSRRVVDALLAAPAMERLVSSQPSAGH